MNIEFIRDRITQLRLHKGVSEYKMSYELGHCRGYINNISSGKTLPSMTEFLAICEYFSITPSQFFSEEADDPKLIEELYKLILQLDEDDTKLVLMNIKRLLKK